MGGRKQTRRIKRKHKTKKNKRAWRGMSVTATTPAEDAEAARDVADRAREKAWRARFVIDRTKSPMSKTELWRRRPVVTDTISSPTEKTKEKNKPVKVSSRRTRVRVGKELLQEEQLGKKRQRSKQYLSPTEPKRRRLTCVFTSAHEHQKPEGPKPDEWVHPTITHLNKKPDRGKSLGKQAVKALDLPTTADSYQPDSRAVQVETKRLRDVNRRLSQLKALTKRAKNQKLHASAWDSGIRKTKTREDWNNIPELAKTIDKVKKSHDNRVRKTKKALAEAKKQQQVPIIPYQVKTKRQSVDNMRSQQNQTFDLMAERFEHMKRRGKIPVADKRPTLGEVTLTSVDPMYHSLW
ncbi:hypothetical protein Pelo_8413 [Pelomyxa schiedti]|nr:hypothetical protein Pelo_8413 [Pelomyxa schiedti]